MLKEKQYSRASAHVPCATSLAGALLGALVVSYPALAADSDSSKGSASPSAPAAVVPLSAEYFALDSVGRARALDPSLAYKGWAISGSTFGDSVFHDDGGFRSALASYGFGFTLVALPIMSQNLLNTPDAIPYGKAPNGATYPTCTALNISHASCAGGRSYIGQRLDYGSLEWGFLTYDASRIGLQGGQFQLGFGLANNTNQNLAPNTARLNTLAYFQPLFDKKLELHLGYFPTVYEYIGTYVGGTIVNPLGTSGTIPVQMGMTTMPFGTPAARVTYHLTDQVYNSLGVNRSTPVNGPTGSNPYDEATSNISGFNFGSTIPGTGNVYIEEFGYKQNATMNDNYTWFRMGGIYNDSKFKDYRERLQQFQDHLTPTALTRGDAAVYALVDQQIWKPDPHSGYRGIYAGASFLYADPRATVTSRDIEFRLYWKGPFESRLKDQISLVYTQYTFSKYLIDYVDAAYSAGRSAFYGAPRLNAVTAAYNAHLSDGIFITPAIGWTDNPGVTLFHKEGHSLVFQLSSFINF